MDERGDRPGQTKPLTAALKGILFDFDGTLADTMEGHYLAWKSALGEHGIPIEADDYYPMEGAGLREVAREFTKGLDWTEAAIDELVRKKKKYYVERQSITFFPGVELLISELKDRKVPMAIVTAGHLDQLRLSVPQRFLEQFDALITGDQFVRGKPDPEPYLRGAEKLGLTPADCIAIENSPLGVQAARRANIYCIAICSTIGRNGLLEADEILELFVDVRNSVAIGKMLGTN
ncbi:MAG TPA: HAD family phosphatase [Geobacteraceae bacterium]|nr:HAD family phosphatase [Geobacteraceae bacterium]